MAALTAATTVTNNAGSQMKYTFTFSAVADGDTFASGLGDRVLDFYYVGTADTTTQASGGGNVANSSGTFTFYPSEDSNAGKLVVMANGS